MLSHQVPAGGFWSFGTKVRVAPMPHAGVKSRVTCVCSAAVSARHSSSLTTVLALMTETAISGIDTLRMSMVWQIGQDNSLMAGSHEHLLGRERQPHAPRREPVRAKQHVDDRHHVHR